MDRIAKAKRRKAGKDKKPPDNDPGDNQGGSSVPGSQDDRADEEQTGGPDDQAQGPGGLPNHYRHWVPLKPGPGPALVWR
jgi:hypothetical protein